MEMWARFAHRELWHDYAPGWALHKSHHEPRTGPFEANDIFAVMNAVPAMGLCMYGFFTPNMSGGLAFGAGLGITLFGIMYMFFHDGLVHRWAHGWAGLLRADGQSRWADLVPC
jgi:beta-carotene 3-hydroxylase